jgi:hypothetical protein
MDETNNYPLKDSEKMLEEIPEVSKDLATQQTQALTVLAQSVATIANFLQGGGLTQILNGYAKSQSVKDILGGLAAHDGRNALDARVLGQNAIEIVEQVEKVFDKYHERLQSKERRDPEIKDAEKDYAAWKELLKNKDD